MPGWLSTQQAARQVVKQRGFLLNLVTNTMGATLSTSEEPHDEGITVVSTGTARRTQNDESLMQRLAGLKHVSLYSTASRHGAAAMESGGLLARCRQRCH